MKWARSQEVRNGQQSRKSSFLARHKKSPVPYCLFYRPSHYQNSSHRIPKFTGRLRTIQAALDLVNGLLDAEETLSQEFVSSWVHQEAKAAEATAENKSGDEEPQEEGSEPQPELSREELRTQGLDEPLEPILSSVDQSRRLLREFEAQLPELRRQLASGRGWFEVFYVSKRHYKQEVIAYATALQAFRERGSPIPHNVIDALHPQVARIIQAGGGRPAECWDVQEPRLSGPVAPAIFSSMK
ncbi:MAG: hypothetical protein H0U76_25470 [Ktedonobacteraceae bacterium]|nr:hypothetical protein [Ktedonobacteraceae bacterium]